MSVGRRIKEKRMELDMTLEQLAVKLGINKSTVYRYETGEIEKMPIGVIKPIADALCTTPAYLLGWDQAEIDAIDSVQQEVIEYETKIDGILAELLDLDLNEEEAKDVVDYAKYIVSKRK